MQGNIDPDSCFGVPLSATPKGIITIYKIWVLRRENEEGNSDISESRYVYLIILLLLGHRQDVHHVLPFLLQADHNLISLGQFFDIQLV
jgi:hypothetical protein